MAQTRADELIELYGKFSPMSVNEANAIAKRVFGEQPVDREEAEILLGASELFSSTDTGWRHIVTQEVLRHMLACSTQGEMQEGAEDWLIATLATAHVEERLALELVHDVMRNAANATQRLGRLGLRAALSSMKAVTSATQNLKASTA